MRWFIAATAVIIGAASPALAERSGLAVQRIEDCRAVAEDPARLKCFDAAAKALAEATSRKDIVVLDREDVTRTRKGLFGFSLPHLPFFGSETDKHGSDKEQINELDLAVANAREIGYGKWRIAMDNGSVWTTSEPLSGSEPRPGQSVHIARGAMGSYFLKLKGGLAVRARRET